MLRPRRLLVSLLVCLTAFSVTAAEYVVTNRNDSGAGSLRQAILDANAAGGSAVIRFQLASASRTIELSSALPPIHVPVTLDGRRTPAATMPGIELSGANITARNAVGLRINGTGSIVQGLAVNRFPGTGIHITAPDVKIYTSFIGVAIDGVTAAGNRDLGIFAEGAFVTIGGPGALRNVISGNGHSGVGLAGDSGRVETNLIGVDVTGSRALPNQGSGVQIAGERCVVGGTQAEPVVISGNRGYGVDVFGRETRIYGAAIGVDVTRRVALGNQMAGILVLNAAGAFTSIGREGVAAPDNVIAANGRSGILLESTVGSVAMECYVVNNAIGIGADGERLGNGGHGVEIIDSRANRIGTTSRGNTIAFNALAGIAVIGGGSLKNEFALNSIYENGGLGIDLGADGVTPNDSGDADSGPNNRANFPVLASAVGSSVSTSIAGTLSALPSSVYRIDYFASPLADPSGYGEGRRHIGSFSARTNSSGVATLATSLPVGAGVWITATATDFDRYDTSEFSPAIGSVATTPNGVLRFATSEVSVAESQRTIDVVVTRENGTSGTVTVDYETVDLTATAGSDYVVARGRVTFAAGEAATNITLRIEDDTETEEPERFLVRLLSTTGGALIASPNEMSVRILSDDGTPAVDLVPHFTAPMRIDPGDILFFRANVTNRGSATLIDGTLLVSIRPDPVVTHSEECAPFGAAYRCRIGSLAPGATASFFFASVTGMDAGITELHASAEAVVPAEPDRSNNESTVQVVTGEAQPKRRSARH